MAGRIWIASALLALGGTSAWAQTEEIPDYATGAEPVAPEVYASLPKQSRFRAFLPKRVDLSSFFPPPGNQGGQPSCVAWATAYAARGFLYGENLGRQPVALNEQMSPSYVYNRLRPNDASCRGTVGIVNALDLLKTEGVVSLADFPYDPYSCKASAPITLTEKAAAMRITDWRAIDRVQPGFWTSPIILDDVKGALARGAPVIFAMPAAPDFKAHRGEAIYTKSENPRTNYHAMALVGYDEDRQALRLINSWGTGWGDKGYAWISYDTFKLLAGEAYSLEAAPAKVDAPKPAPVRTARQQFDDRLLAVPCGSIAARTTANVLTVTGFSGDVKAMDELKAAAFAVDPKTSWQVAYRPWPQCEAELTLASALRAGGVTIAAETETGRMLAGDPVAMVEGQKFGVVATTTAAKPYLSIIYLQADGSAVQLYSGRPAPDSRNMLRVAIGQGGPTEARFEVAGPFGHEVLIALASSKPLFGDELKSYTTEREFLTALRAKLTATPRDTVAASVLRVKTSG